MVRLEVPLCTLGEGPLWHKETDEFVFTDIVNGILYAWSPKIGQSRILLKCSYQLGAFLFDSSGDLILFTECGVYGCSYRPENRQFVLLFNVKMSPGERFNDAICDPMGRMIAGTKKIDNQDGSLYLFEQGKPPRCLMRGLMISNGMGFSPDCSFFYHTDSGRRSIYAYQYHCLTGELSIPEISYNMSGSGNVSEYSSCISPDDGPYGFPVWQDIGEDQAVPDGMTVDSCGMIWTAFWGRGCIACINPQTRQIETVFSVPASQVSSLCFGGDRLDQILVTSAAIQTGGAPNGEIYCMDIPVSGKEEYRFPSFSIPSSLL